MTLNLKINTDSFFKLYLLFLPFTQALTINIGFPLKISEFVLFGLILVILVQGKLNPQMSLIFHKNKTILFFLFWVSLSYLVNFFWVYNYNFKIFPNRISPSIDSLLKLVYIFLAVSSYFISTAYISKNISILKYWVHGAVLAALYGWYLFISSGFNLPYFKLIGMDEDPQTLYGFIRCGTFKEGNYFGLYLLISAVIAFYLRKTRLAIFLLASIISTFSSISIISAILFLLIILRKKILQKKVFIYSALILPFIILTFIQLKQTKFYNEYIVAKLAEPSNVLSSRNISKVDRTLTARIAFNLGLNNPIFGVGPYNYGLHYDQYNDYETKIANINNDIVDFFERTNKRAIPNNVYLELWAEYGIIGFIIFTLFLLNCFITAIKGKNIFLIGGFFSLLLSLNAFPSFTLLFIWGFLAIINAHYIYKAKNTND